MSISLVTTTMTTAALAIAWMLGGESAGTPAPAAPSHAELQRPLYRVPRPGPALIGIALGGIAGGGATALGALVYVTTEARAACSAARVCNDGAGQEALFAAMVALPIGVVLGGAIGGVGAGFVDDGGPPDARPPSPPAGEEL